MIFTASNFGRVGYIEKKHRVIPLFRRIAHSETIEESEKAIDELKNSDHWKKDGILRDYFTNYWLKINEVCKHFPISWRKVAFPKI